MIASSKMVFGSILSIERLHTAMLVDEPSLGVVFFFAGHRLNRRDTYQATRDVETAGGECVGKIPEMLELQDYYLLKKGHASILKIT